MAIGTDAAIEVFGTTDPVDDGTTSAISNAAMSVLADITAWTNDDDVPTVMLILRWQFTTGTIAGNIDIHVRPINVDGTDDPPQPTATDQLGYAGSFEIATLQAADVDMPYTQIVPLMSFSTKTSQEYEFYLFNGSGVEILANWDLDVIPKTLAPVAA